MADTFTVGGFLPLGLGCRSPLSAPSFLGWLRGALGLVLALALPDTVPERDDIIIAAFAVVAFSIFVQGLTMPLLMRRLGLVEEESEPRKARSHV